MRIATPQLTCCRITARGPSATCGETSTPRLIGPGCITIASGFANASVRSRQPERARQLARVGEPRRLALEPLVLDAQHHHDVGAVEAVLEPRCTTRTRSRVTSPPISSMPRGISVRGATSRTRAPSLARHRMFERATRECAMSPTIATSSPSSVALVPADRRGVEQRLRRVLVLAVAGVDHGAARRLARASRPRRRTSGARRSRRGASPRGCAPVSSSVSPLVVDDAEPEMLIASADSRFAASSNDVRVRVEFSKNRLITVRPRSDRQLLDRLVGQRPVTIAVVEDRARSRRHRGRRC